MRIAISAENTIDLPKELLEKYDIHTISFDITLGDKTANNYTTKEIFDFVDKTGVLPKTSAINEVEYGEYFEDMLKSYDAVVHFALSSGISCTYSNAQRAAANMKNCYVVDSKSLSTGIALIAIYASKLAATGMDAAEIAAKCAERVQYVQASFVIERLDFLHKGGRCSGLQLLGANLLKLRPQIKLKDGKMVPGKKFRGSMDDVFEKHCADTLAEFNNPDKSIGFVTYTSASDRMVEIGREALKNAGFKEIYNTFAGPTIGSHCGRNSIGILYINDGGKE